MLRRVTDRRPAMLSIILPAVLFARKLRDRYFADKFLRECSVRRAKTDGKVCRMVGVLVNRQECPLLVWPMSSIDRDRRIGWVDSYRIYFMNNGYRLHPIAG